MRLDLGFHSFKMYSVLENFACVCMRVCVCVCVCAILLRIYIEIDANYDRILSARCFG
jgi:hypothetical protein